MKLLKPNSKDIADIGLAIKSFSGAWGSIDPFGEYQPLINGKTLWLMFKFDIDDIKLLLEETAPSKYVKEMEDKFEEEQGVLHGQASKIKTGFFRNAWVLKVTYLIDRKTFPVGFLGAYEQTSLWQKFHETLNFKERFLLTAETAISPYELI